MKYRTVSLYKQILVIFLMLIGNFVFAQEIKSFSTLGEVLDFSKSNNYVFENASIKTQMALLTKKSAIANIINPKVNTSFQMIDNFNQQKSYLPAEVFGGNAGDFKEVIIGQQYISTFNIQPQFDIINLANFAQVKTAKINEQLVENVNQINEQSVYEKINTIYFNILSLNGQKDILKENIIIAETIFKIISQKYNEGIARKQEVNEAEVNLIAINDKLEQLEINLKIQYQILNLFFENTVNANLTQNVWDFKNDKQILSVPNNLQNENIVLQTKLAEQEYKSIRNQHYPTISFVSSFNWQNLSNDVFFAKYSNWQNFNYIGLKINLELPTVQRLSNTKSKQLQLDILKNEDEHVKNETDSKNTQLDFEYEKALMQIGNSEKIYALKKDTYEKNFNQFKENILSLDKLLISQNDMILSKLNVVFALANIGFNKNKIEINNKF